jgi:ketosteroid isomerase-like protein
MERRERETFVSPTEETVPLESEQTIASPRFDEKSIQRARPAEPLMPGGRLRSWPLTVLALCVAGGVLGGVLGGLGIAYYQRVGPRVASEAQQARQESAGATTAAPATATTAAPAPDVPTTNANAAGAVTDGAASPRATAPAADGTGAQPSVVNAGARQAGAARDSAPADGGGEAVEADAATQGELRTALGEWVAATNARDVGRQMNFYAPSVDAFYLSRNASRAAVRAEKARVFAAAQAVNVQAAQPDIRLSRDGRTAVMRFRKRYQITGGGGERSGEVLQELRWRRTPSGWKIVSERDLRVLQ